MKQRRPENLRDLTFAVMFVDHPDLQDLDRRFLSALALYANYRTGAGAHPGTDALCKAMRRSAETVRRVARRVEGLGLVELTGKANGKDNANEWRICLEHNAFPDNLATHLPHTSPTESEVSPTKPVSLPHTPAELAPRLRVDPTSTSTYTNNKPTTRAANEVSPVAANSALSTVFRRLVGMYLKAEERVPKINAANKAELLNRIAANADEVISAWAACISVRPWNGATTHPFRYLLEDYETYATMANHKKESVIPQAEVDAAAAQFVEHHKKIWSIPEPEANEGDGSELFEAATLSRSSEGENI